MKSIRYRCLLIILISLLSGCASVNTGSLFQKELLKDNKANVYIYRPDVFPASFISPTLYVDGEKTFNLAESSYVALSLPLGKHTFETRDEGNLLTACVVSGFKFDLASNDDHYIRWEPFISETKEYFNPITFYTVTVEFSADIKIVSELQAIPEIQQYRKVIK